MNRSSGNPGCLYTAYVIPPKRPPRGKAHATVPELFVKGTTMKKSKRSKPPWAMFSFMVNVVRLILTIIHSPLD
jgi:hypothetical protein